MRILVAFNGSSNSETMLRLGTLLARNAGEPPTLLTVVKHETGRLQAEAALARVLEVWQTDLPAARTKILVGQPTEQILREGREGDYDLIVLGQRPQLNGVTRWLPASTSQRVVDQASCSVLVVKGQSRRIRRILLCDSGAPSGSTPEAGSSLLARLTTHLAELLDGEEEITVLHVMSQMSAGPGVRGAQLRARAEELIEARTPEGELLVRDLQALERPGVHPHAEVRHGLVVDEILAEAQSGDYDLVVIGAHRGEGWQRLLLDDLAQRIVAQLDRPVLVVR
jgi:nucleotide-binding universal stress UspA family protein